jgi:hypothetical protein
MKCLMSSASIFVGPWLFIFLECDYKFNKFTESFTFCSLVLLDHLREVDVGGRLILK